MNLFSTNFSAVFAELLTTALIHFIWQGALLVLILCVILKLFDVKTARRKYLLGVGTLLMMGMAPIVTAMFYYENSQTQQFRVEAPDPSNPMIEVNVVNNVIYSTGRVVADDQKGSANSWNPGIKVSVLMAWLAGVIILSTRLAIGFGVTLWIRANLKPVSEEFEQRIRILGDRLNVEAHRRVFTCARIGQAVAVGFIRPIVLIPAAWLTQFSPEMIEAVIAHELAHIRRWDLWVNLVQRIVETLLFFHPAVWWLSNQIRLEREMCCDEIAAECFDRVSYVRSLESVANCAHGNVFMATSIGGGTKMKLLTRVRYLLGVAPADTAGNWWAVGFLATILLVAVATAFSLSVSVKPTLATVDNKSSPAPAKAVEKVITTNPVARSVTVTEQYVCQINAQRHIEIRALANGHLESIPIKEGQQVKEGDLMFMVIPVLYQSKLDAENADARIAQLEFNYTQKLFADKSVSQNEVALHEAKLAKANAKARQAATELEFAKIKAPFDGIVDRFRCQKGSLVLVGDVLTTFSDNSIMSVYFNVPETRYLEYMADPQSHTHDPQVELMLANGSKFAQVGRINSIQADFNSETGSIPFRADFPNPDRLLRHGQRGSVLINRELKDAIVLPQRAIFEDRNRRFVYVVDKDDVARQREVIIQNELEDLFVIKKGVGVDDKIVLDGIRRIHDGDKVECETITSR